MKMNNTISETGKIQLQILKGRVGELNQELKEFEILEVEAVTLRDKIKWGLRVAETKELLQLNTTGLEIVDKLMGIQSEIEQLNEGDMAGMVSLLQELTKIAKEI